MCVYVRELMCVYNCVFHECSLMFKRFEENLVAGIRQTDRHALMQVSTYQENPHILNFALFLSPFILLDSHGSLALPYQRGR